MVSGSAPYHILTSHWTVLVGPPAFRRHRRITIFLALLLGLNGCAQAFDATTLGVEAQMASPASAPPNGQEFEINAKTVYLLWGVLRISKPDLGKILAAQVSGDAKVANLKIRVRSRWSDILLTVLTAGLIVPRSVTFEGVVVQQ